MNRRAVLIGGATLSTVALAGCLDMVQGDESDDSDGDGGGADGRSVVVRNAGEVEAEPDLAVLDLGVEVRGDDASSVRDELSERADALVDALVEWGIDEDDVTTRRFHISERRDRQRMEREGVDPDSREAEEYVEFVGVHSYEVEVQDPDDAGEVLDVAVDAGADDVGRVEFTLSDERRAELREEALEEALADARSEAEFVAEEVDGRIVEEAVVDTSGGDVTPVYEEFDDAGAATETPASGDAATTFEPGDVTVSAEVNVRYEME